MGKSRARSRAALPNRESRVERRARERNRARIEIAEKERAKKVHSKRKNKNGRGCWETRMRR